jgi:hypothetical protein
MKPKDIGFVQQHIEKIILGVALLFVLLVLWLYVLGSPYSVKLGSRDKVPPGEVMSEVRQKASMLDSRLKATDSPLPETPVPDYTTEFASRYRRLPLAMARFNVPLHEPGLGDFAPPPPPTRLVEMPAVPAPTQIKARGGYSVLAEFDEPAQAEPFIRLIGEQVPRDFIHASASAVFSFAQLEEVLKQVHIDKRIPEAWWRGRLWLTAVHLEREELDPVTGRWGNLTRIAHLPDQIAYGVRDRQYDAGEATQTVQQVIEDQPLIQRPPFPRTYNVWSPPDVEIANFNEEDQRRLLRLDTEIAGLRRQIQVLERRAQPGAAAPDRPRPPVVRGPREFEGAAGDVMRQPPGTPAEPGSQLEQLRRQLIEKINESNRLRGVETPATDGFDMYVPGMMEGRDPMRSPPPMGHIPGQAEFGDSGTGQPGMAIPEVKVWAHDLTVEHGKTYRYRIIVDVLNPLFQKRGVDPEQERENFHKLSIAAAPSEWSAPVTIEPAIQFFLTRAQASNAQLEIWRIFNGRWEDMTVTVRPGEIMGDVKTVQGDIPATVAMKINGMVVDLREVSLGGRFTDNTWELLYVDLDSREIKVRNLLRDQNDPNLLRLRAEKARGAVALQP